ncbi:MAG: hypothetical protein WDO69_14610 [Pseudomonadota bacterium]
MSNIEICAAGGLGLVLCSLCTVFSAQAEPAAAEHDAKQCNQAQPAGMLNGAEAQQVMWSYYFQGPAASPAKPPPAEAFPIACQVESSAVDQKARTAARALTHLIANCTGTKMVFNDNGGGMGQIVNKCAHWEFQPRVSISPEGYLSNLEKLGVSRPSTTCLDQAAELIRPRLQQHPNSRALIQRLDRTLSSHHAAASCAAAANPTAARAGDMSQGEMRPQSAEQSMYLNMLRGRDKDHELENDQRHQELSDREGNGTTDSPDEASRLRREARELLALHRSAKAVEALQRSVAILTLAFGASDAEVKAVGAELQNAQKAAGAAREGGVLSPACAAGLPARALDPQQIMSALRGYYQAHSGGAPLPPTAYGPACRALDGEPIFDGETWSNPVVTRPLMSAAEESLTQIPKAAAVQQASGLIDEAEQIGLGVGPEFSAACPNALLDFAQRLLASRGLPVDARIAPLRAQLQRVRVCAQSSRAAGR